MKSVRILHGSQRIASVDPSDRGLNYGDGVFETLRVHQAQPIWWREHWDRLLLGCARLGITAPDEHLIRAEAERLLEGEPHGVLKILVSAGIGCRGYRREPMADPTVILSSHALPPMPDPRGLCLRWCRTALAIQPALAGIKHLNRLEQVLARAEWADPGIDEGLMCDADGRVICATAANVFVLIDGRWLTPAIQGCGVAGVTRAWLLRHLQDSAEAELRPDDLQGAEAMFLCNAVRGVMPVRQLDSRYFEDVQSPSRVRELLAHAVPAFQAMGEMVHGDAPG